MNEKKSYSIYYTCDDLTGVQPSASKTGPVWATGFAQQSYNNIALIISNVINFILYIQISNNDKFHKMFIGFKVMKIRCCELL